MPGRCRGGLVALAFVFAATNPPPTPAAGAPAKAVQVAIEHFAFSPRTLTVPVGSKVVWTNRDEEPHTVTSAGGGFGSSAALDTGDTHAAIFSKPGTYAYYCTIHPMMVGTIVVK
jgi:plastocyanin